MNLRQPRRPKRFSIRLLGTLLALGLLAYLLGRNWREIVEALLQMGLGQMLLALAMISVSRLAIAGRWHVILHGGGAHISPGQTLRLTYAGLFASNFLPTTIGGDVVRLAGGFQLGLDGAVCAASLVVDRLVGVAGMLVALPFGLQALWAGAAGSVGQEQAVPVAAAALGENARRIWAKSIGVGKKLLAALGLWLRRPWSLAEALGVTWLHMLLLFSTLWMLLRAMGDPTPFIVIAGLWSLVYFVTLLPFSVNGLGLQEVSLTFVLTNLGGVSVQNALALALVIRTLFMLASLPGAAFLPSLLAGAKAVSSDQSASER